MRVRSAEVELYLPPDREVTLQEIQEKLETVLPQGRFMVRSMSRETIDVVDGVGGGLSNVPAGPWILEVVPL